MPERKETHEESTLPIIVTRTGGGGGKGGHGKLLDPHAAMPGAIKRVGSDHGDEVEAVDQKVADKADLRRKYFEFVHHLAHPTNDWDIGNPVPALAATFGVSLEEAQRRQVELHDALTGAARATTFGESLRKKNADVNARVSRLSDFMYSPDPKVSLVAIRLLNDMDEGATSVGEETIEDHIAALLEE